MGLSADDLDRLMNTPAGGMISHITHRHGRLLPEQSDEFLKLERLCEADYLYLERIDGHAHEDGEQCYTYMLTAKGRAAVAALRQPDREPAP